jgi:hypothetical protein
MSKSDWVDPKLKALPTKVRLLLLVSAAGNPPDAQLMDKSEVVVGYWTGGQFRQKPDQRAVRPIQNPSG